MLRTLRSLAVFAVLLALLTTLLPAQVSSAADPFMSEEEALELLTEYRIVRGDPSGAVNVTDNLSRAQAAAIFVRALNMESLAQLLKDVVPFSDAKGHWAAGEIAMVERLGLMRGDGNGRFRPDDNITYIEVLTVLLRMVDQEPSGPWNPASITVMANRMGLTPDVPDLKQPAVRGKMFWSTAVAISNIPVDADGTLMQKHLDSQPPRLVLETTAIKTETETVTIRGVTEGAAKVFVDGVQATLDPTSGAFSYEAQVPVGTTALLVRAEDYAGNEQTASVSVERRGVVSRLRVTGPAWVLAGSSTKLSVEVKDSRGNDLPRDGIQVEVTGKVATFDLSTGTLTAGAKSGSGTLTLKSGTLRSTYSFQVLGPSESATALAIAPINSNRAPAVDQEVTVTVQVVGPDGRLVADDYGRTISLRSTGLGGLVITPIKPVTEKGLATFTVKGTQIGDTLLEATTPGLTSASRPLEILSSLRVQLTASVTSMKPDGTSTATIKASLLNQNGSAVTNTSNADIQIQLTAIGTDGVLTDEYIVIPRGRSNSSGNDGTFRAGIASGTVVIKGAYLSVGHNYSIQSLNLPVTDPLAGVKLELTSSPATTTPGGQVTLTLKVLDSGNRTVNTGSYAFQLRVATSNSDPMVNGLPDGAELSFSGSSYTPVDDGRPATDLFNNQYSIVGRTSGGTATFTLRYNRSGVLTVIPVAQPSMYEAYHPTLGFGPASTSAQLAMVPVNVTFSGTPVKIVLTADSDLGSDEPAAATTTAKQLRVRAKVVDSSGALVPGYNEPITLSRLAEGDAVSGIVGITTRNAVNGVAEFVVQTTATEGFDLYRATAGSMVSENMTVAVRRVRAEAPQIVAIRGIKEGDLDPVPGYVGPEADYMDIQLMPETSFLSGEPTNWVTARVYQKGDTRVLFQSRAFDLNTPVPTIRIPKALLQVGERQYEVVVNNGAGDSPRSPTLDEISKAVNAIYYSNYRLTAATYDASTGRLTLAASGLVTNGVVDPAKIKFVKDLTEVPLGGATVVTNSGSGLILDLGELAAAINPDQFHGPTLISTDTGWFTDAAGSQIGQPQQVGVSPMAVIRSAAIDVANKYLYLHGEGLQQGTISPGLITVSGPDASVTLHATQDQVTSITNALVVVRLSQATLDSLVALNGPLHVTAETGWLRNSAGHKVGAISGTQHPVQMHVRVISATYDPATKTLRLEGDGFTGATINPALLSFRRTTSDLVWSPGSTIPVAAVSDTTIEIAFEDADASLFESQFAGKNLYVNTLDGWLVDALGRTAIPIPANTVLFTAPTN